MHEVPLEMAPASAEALLESHDSTHASRAPHRMQAQVCAGLRIPSASAVRPLSGPVAGMILRAINGVPADRLAFNA